MKTDARFEDGKLIVTGVYDSPREDVFEAWVETSKVEQWWGCAECTSVTSEIDPRVGGKYNHCMTIEGVGEVPTFATVVEYDPPSRLAYESYLPGDESVKMRVTVDFSEVDGGTQVRLVHEGIPDVRVDGDQELREIVRSGWLAASQKLGRVLRADQESASPSST